ncbi:hypothetical protein C6A36_00310 [Desulfobacteraceae bacterium SEEP-SAG10]|nr:hypothetical protein C6A36_00310 [Desulfobacteraceae bacterium SEEP-SAG10]
MGSMGALCITYEMRGDTRVPVEVVIGANIIPAKEQDFAETVCLSPELPVDVKKKEKPVLAGKYRKKGVALFC